MELATLAARLGPVALVTGASSGIGQSFARLLARLGFDLVLIARRTDRLAALRDELHAAHGTACTLLPIDLAAPDAAAQILAATQDIEIGLVVSNAGFSVKGDFAGGDAAEMAAMIAVNCTTPMLLAHGMIPRLRARRAQDRGAALIFTGSVEGLIACPYSTAYSASKAMVKAMGEGLWAELEPEGIAVMALLPGATATEAGVRHGLDMAALPNVQSPDDVAHLALEHLGEEPVYVPSDHYRASFAQLLAAPRKDALRMMAGAMKPRG